MIKVPKDVYTVPQLMNPQKFSRPPLLHKISATLALSLLFLFPAAEPGDAEHSSQSLLTRCHNRRASEQQLHTVFSPRLVLKLLFPLLLRMLPYCWHGTGQQCHFCSESSTGLSGK